MGATGVALGVHEQGAGGGDAAVAAAAAAAATEPKKVSHVPLFLGAEDSAGALSTSVSKLGNVMPALLRSNILCMSRQDSTFTSTVISEFFSMRMHAHVCVCVCACVSPSLPPSPLSFCGLTCAAMSMPYLTLQKNKGTQTMQQLWAAFPARYQHCDAHLLFATARDGYNLVRL